MVAAFLHAAHDHALLASFDCPASIASGGERLISQASEAFAGLNLADLQRVSTGSFAPSGSAKARPPPHSKTVGYPGMIRRLAEPVAREG